MDYHSSLLASLDVFERIASESSTTVQYLKKLIDDVDKSRPSDAETKVFQLHNRLDRLLNELVELAADYASLDMSTVEIPWLEVERSKLDMSYLSGRTPWEFSLSYSSKDKVNGIRDVLEAKYNQNGLQRFAVPPKEEQFVVCLGGKKLFRAQILKCFPNGRCRVLKIDSNEEEIVNSGNIFYVPQEVATIPCQVLRCCINKEDSYLADRWVKDLELIFLNTLSEGRLTVDILEKLNCFTPPKFHVRMYVYNEDIQEEINVNAWINGRLLADLQKLNLNDVENILAVLDEESLDPFHTQKKIDDNIHQAIPANLNQIDPSCPSNISAVLREKNSAPGDGEQKTISMASAAVTEQHGIVDEPDPHLIGLSVEKVSTWMDRYSDEKMVKPMQKAPIFSVSQLEEPSFMKPKSSSTNGMAMVVDNLANPKSWVNERPAHSSTPSTSQSACHPVPSINGVHSARSSSTSHSCSGKITLPASPSKQLDKQSPSCSSMSVGAPEFIPSCYVEISPGVNEESYENLICNLEEEYQPKDEKRICLFFQKRGYCHRIACPKEHIHKTNKWTDDVAEIDKGPYNVIDLPREGCETIIKVQHVESSITFYSTLHELYSDINEHGVRETLETLYYDLNSCNTSTPHPLLETPLPAITEMVLALGLQRTLGPGRKWLRAVVTEILDQCTVEVFFTDFGNKEIVSMKDIRQIRPQFLHLPSQAVRTTLAMLEIVPEQRKAGKLFLSQLIKGKLLKAKIDSRDVMNGEMEVYLYTDDNICVNDLMVEKGYCTEL